MMSTMITGGCGSFYSITLSSPLFKGLSTIKQHRLVNECLKEEVKDIHGLQVSGSRMFTGRTPADGNFRPLSSRPFPRSSQEL